MSTALWRPMSSHTKTISPPDRRKQLWVERVRRCRGVSAAKRSAHRKTSSLVHRADTSGFRSYPGCAVRSRVNSTRALSPCSLRVICSTSSAERMTPSVNSRPSVSSVRCSGVQASCMVSAPLTYTSRTCSPRSSVSKSETSPLRSKRENRRRQTGSSDRNWSITFISLR